MGRGATRLAGLGLLATLAGAGGAEAADGPPASSRIAIKDGLAVAALRGALQGAQRRLAGPRCRQIFSDYRDGAGRTLQANLEGIGQDGQAYLGWIHFSDGSAHPRCRQGRVLAFTAPGSRVVFVCGPEFSAWRLRDAAQTEMVVLHEMLHTLGLREDPPSSAAITAQVFARCGG